MKENFCKSDLRTGMLFIRRDGKKFLVMLDNTTTADYISDDECHGGLSYYCEDLKYGSSSRYMDICSVYKPTLSSKLLSFDVDDMKLIWERNDAVDLCYLFETKMYTFNSETGEGFRAEFKGSYHTNEEILYAFIVRESGSFGEGYTFAFGAEHSWIITE